MNDDPPKPPDEYPPIQGDTPRPPPPMPEMDEEALRRQAKSELAKFGVKVGGDTAQPAPQEGDDLRMQAKKALAENGVQVGDFRTGEGRKAVPEITMEELNKRFANGQLTERPLEVKQMRELLERLDETVDLLKQIVGILTVKQNEGM